MIKIIDNIKTQQASTSSTYIPYYTQLQAATAVQHAEMSKSWWKANIWMAYLALRAWTFLLLRRWNPYISNERNPKQKGMFWTNTHGILRSP